MAKYDFMSFGEAMVRFTPPGHDRLGQAEELQLGIAAAELNCCVNISNLSRKLLKPQLKTGFVTKLVDAWDGDYIIKHAQMHGVDMSNVVVSPYDKIGRNGRNGKCFIEVGIGPRPSYQTYDRGHSAVAMIQPGDIDWESVLDTRWFHTTGIITAVGEHTATEVAAALRAAKKNGATTSYDLNFRSTLWSREDAQKAMVEIMPYVDVVIGNEEDFQLALGIQGPESGGKDIAAKIDSFKGMIMNVKAAYPNAKVFATTLRQVVSANEHLWGAILLSGDEWHVIEPRPIQVYDRIGGGDGFVSGMLYGFIKGWDAEKCAQFGWASGALVTTLETDFAEPADEEQIWSIWEGNARVKR